MQRKNISANELREELNRRLHKAIGNILISFGGTTRLVEMDADGSNWSKAIFMQGRQDDIDAYANIIKHILSDAFEEYNLLENE